MAPGPRRDPPVTEKPADPPAKAAIDWMDIIGGGASGDADGETPE